MRLKVGGDWGFIGPLDGHVKERWPTLSQVKQIVGLRHVAVEWPESPHLKQTRVPFLDRERRRDSLELAFWLIRFVVLGDLEVGRGWKEGRCVVGWDKIESRMTSVRVR